MFIKEFVKKILYGNRYSSETYIKYLKRLGVKIGERTVIFSPRETFIDEQYPWMVEIGNDVQITRGVIILTHSYDWSVVKKKYSRLYGASGNVVIKDNVFIGVNTVILKGVTIGENSIISAGSVVAKDIPANSVAVGNPAKVIHKIDNNYLKKYSDRQEKEAIDLAVGYYNRYKKWPDNTIFYDYFWLWNDDKDYEKIPRYKYEMELLGNYEDCMKNLKLIRQNPRYASFDEFIEKCKCLV